MAKESKSSGYIHILGLLILSGLVGLGLFLQAKSEESVRNRLVLSKSYVAQPINSKEDLIRLFEDKRLSLNLNRINSIFEQTSNKNGITESLFVVKGSDDVKLLGLFRIQAPVEVSLDSQTGAQESFQEPWYLHYFGFLFRN